ncbi:hypothetical protein B4923_04780 [Brenneria roseae subsp. americana]|uniref:DUF2681 domain-containing protein n=1 Tax=Brenneria roseae subsp. americana TaxID=1508507 RepID=A0A2U1TXU3_9GAMM|nr:DUF2681 domain-containing protein [Brenneria roseae]PWC14226.1 hypothetical protein B4923_04780 [Brenneria roseae subsp. americana]
MSLEIIIAGVLAVIAAIAAAFWLGHSKGKGTAESKAEKQQTEEVAAATKAVAERQVTVTKEAANVQQTVSHMPDDDVDRELRENWSRPASRD